MDHPYSYKGWMSRNFYDRVNPSIHVPLEQRLFPDISRLNTMAIEWSKSGHVEIDDHHS